MRYEKPELTAVGSALAVIKGGPHKFSDDQDSGQNPGLTPGAYEADE